MERASTRKAAMRNRVVWEPSVVMRNSFLPFSYLPAARFSMNSRNRVFYSLSATLLPALLIGGCGAVMERRTAHIGRRWPAGAIHHVEVREVDGAINIEAGSDNEIAMDANVRSRRAPRNNQENLGYFSTELSGDTLIIGRRNEHHFRFFGFGNETRVDYDLRVPASVALDLRTVNGRIATHGVDGEMKAVTVNGRVNIDTPGSNEVEAHTVNGRIEARFARSFQGATLETVNGGGSVLSRCHRRGGADPQQRLLLASRYRPLDRRASRHPPLRSAGCGQRACAMDQR